MIELWWQPVLIVPQNEIMDLKRNTICHWIGTSTFMKSFSNFTLLLLLESILKSFQPLLLLRKSPLWVHPCFVCFVYTDQQVTDHQHFLVGTNNTRQEEELFEKGFANVLWGRKDIKDTKKAFGERWLWHVHISSVCLHEIATGHL